MKNYIIIPIMPPIIYQPDFLLFIKYIYKKQSSFPQNLYTISMR